MKPGMHKPWRRGERKLHCFCAKSCENTETIVAADGTVILDSCTAGDDGEEESEILISQKHLDHIILCVNACEGLSNRALSALVTTYSCAVCQIFPLDIRRPTFLMLWMCNSMYIEYVCLVCEEPYLEWIKPFLCEGQSAVEYDEDHRCPQCGVADAWLIVKMPYEIHGTHS